MNKCYIMFRKIIKWFNLKLGWFFVNGRKSDNWGETIKDKYKD